MIEIVVVAQPNPLHLGLGRDQNLHRRRAPPFNRAETTQDNPLLFDRTHNRQCTLFLLRSPSRLSSYLLFLAPSESHGEGILFVHYSAAGYRILV